MYKRVQNEFTGTLTGKAIEWGGSNIRPEATGYGAVYFGLEILKDQGDTIVVSCCFIGISAVSFLLILCARSVDRCYVLWPEILKHSPEHAGVMTLPLLMPHLHESQTEPVLHGVRQ
jgi:hypothetical protein